MAKPTGDEIALHYAAAHARIVELAAGLSDEQLATPVPATPGWTVHDVLAHLAAIPTDAMAGRITGIPSEDETKRQVEERRDQAAAALIDEWTPNVQPMCEGAVAGLVPPNLAVDALTHEQDIRGALGLPPAIDPAELRFCTNLYSFGCSYALRSHAVPPLSIEASDTDFRRVAGEDEPQTTMQAPEFELFRALSGRRSRGQVLGFAWDGDAEAYLDHVNIFGSLPVTDVVDA